MPDRLDLDALEHGCPTNGAACPICELIAELRATRAERDEADAAHCDCCHANANAWQDALARAERAERRCSELTLLLTDAEADRDDAMQRHTASERAARKAEAALARVEEWIGNDPDLQAGFRAALRGDH
jgi:hypothetical protein